jgi:nicotinamide N-methyltransferase
LSQTEKFFPLAEAGGFIVTKIFEKLMGEVLFEDDPGVSELISSRYDMYAIAC